MSFANEEFVSSLRSPYGRGSILEREPVDDAGDEAKTSQQQAQIVQKSLQEQWDEAIAKIIAQIQQQSEIQDVEQAIESLTNLGGQYADVSTSVMYLHKVPESPGFMRKDVSVFLADLGDDSVLLHTYFQLVHFGGLSIEDSLRLYFVELRLVSLANHNLLSTLLFALATAFTRNAGNFKGDVDDCVRVYHTMIMLNESLHSKNAAGRGRQTEQQFMEIINDRLASNVYAFEEENMRRIYQSIKKHALDQRKRLQSIQKNEVRQVTAQTAHQNYVQLDDGKTLSDDQKSVESSSSSMPNCCVVM